MRNIIERFVLFAIFFFAPLKVSLIALIVYVIYKTLIDGISPGVAPGISPFIEDDSGAEGDRLFTIGDQDDDGDDGEVGVDFDEAEDRLFDNVDVVVLCGENQEVNISALSCAAIIAKAGRKVLIIENPEAKLAVNRGEIISGEMEKGSLMRTLSDQLTRGKMKWTKIEAHFEEVVSVSAREIPEKRFGIRDAQQFGDELVQKFSIDEEKVGEYFCRLAQSEKFAQIANGIKMLPYAVTWIINKTGIINHIADFNWNNGEEGKSELNYDWPVFAPLRWENRRRFLQSGAFYSGSNFALGVQPAVERSGGKILLNAKIDRIIHKKEKIIGVKINGKEIKCRNAISCLSLKRTYELADFPSVNDNYRVSQKICLGKRYFLICEIISLLSSVKNRQIQILRIGKKLFLGIFPVVSTRKVGEFHCRK